MRDIYLDNAATTFPKPEKVYVQMDKVNRELAVNAGRGSYALGREATNIIDQVREELLALTNAKQVAKVVLTASATIALNEIIGGIGWKKEDVVYVSPYEHNAVMRPLHLMQQQYGFRVEELPYQYYIKQRLLSFLNDEEQQRKRILVQMPTGTGKTKTAMHTIVNYMNFSLNKTKTNLHIDGGDVK